MLARRSHDATMNRIYQNKTHFIVKNLLLACALAITPSTAFSQKPFRSFSLFHEGGAIVERPITVDFLSDSGTIKNKYIHSLTVLTFDSLVFRDDNPDRPEMIGSPIGLIFKNQGDSLLISRFSPEYYALFVAYHTTRALEYFDCLLGRC